MAHPHDKVIQFDRMCFNACDAESVEEVARQLSAAHDFWTCNQSKAFVDQEERSTYFYRVAVFAKSYYKNKRKSLRPLNDLLYRVRSPEVYKQSS